MPHLGRKFNITQQRTAESLFTTELQHCTTVRCAYRTSIYDIFRHVGEVLRILPMPGPFPAGGSPAPSELAGWLSTAYLQNPSSATYFTDYTFVYLYLQEEHHACMYVPVHTHCMNMFWSCEIDSKNQNFYFAQSCRFPWYIMLAAHRYVEMWMFSYRLISLHTISWLSHQVLIVAGVGK